MLSFEAEKRERNERELMREYWNKGWGLRENKRFIQLLLKKVSNKQQFKSWIEKPST